MAQAARVAWALGSSRCALAEGLRTRPWLPLSSQSRAGSSRSAAGSRGAADSKGSPGLLGAAALALGGALGLYHTVRWHLRSQDLRAERSAAEVRLEWHGAADGELRGQEWQACDLGRVILAMVGAQHVEPCVSPGMVSTVFWGCAGTAPRVIFTERVKLTP